MIFHKRLSDLQETIICDCEKKEVKKPEVKKPEVKKGGYFNPQNISEFMEQWTESTDSSWRQYLIE